MRIVVSRGSSCRSSLLRLRALAVPESGFADELDHEFPFASGLVDLGFPDFADKVVQQVLRLHPDQKDRAKLIQAEILISRRKFAEAEEIVKTMGADNPKAQAISLALAKGYYALGEMDKAKQLYDEFLQAVRGPAADRSGPAAVLPGVGLPVRPDAGDGGRHGGRDQGLRARPGDEARPQHRRAGSWRSRPSCTSRLAAEQPGDQREKYLGEAKKLCDDHPVGRAGHLVRPVDHHPGAHRDGAGRQAAARRRSSQSNMDILKEIDKYLQEQDLPMSVSPMAGARFLLGELLQRSRPRRWRRAGQEGRGDHSLRQGARRVLQRVRQVRRQRLGAAGGRARAGRSRRSSSSSTARRSTSSSAAFADARPPRRSSGWPTTCSGRRSTREAVDGVPQEPEPVPGDDASPRRAGQPRALLRQPRATS